MKLPSISYPTYEIVGAVSKTKIKYRPFLTGEEKILYIAMATKDENQIKNAVIQVLNNCIITPNITAESLPVFDLEKLFLSVRAKSIGEIIDVRVPCDLEEPKNPDEEVVFVDVQLLVDDIVVQVPPGHTNQIKITEDTVLIMNYPGLEDFLSANFVDSTNQTMFDLTKLCLKELIVGETVYDFKDFSELDIDKFINELPTKIFDKIVNFFNDMPKVYYDIEVTNPHSGKITKKRLEGIADFFS